MDGKVHGHQQTEFLGLYKDIQVYSLHRRERIFDIFL